MSRSRRLCLSTVGLAALGLAAGWATRSVVAVPPQVPVPPGPAAPSEAPPTPTVLLLSDGRVIRGEVLETDDGYLVRTPIGRMPFKRREVARTFTSIQELYDHKLALTPDRDPDELMKLAHWCITQGLRDEALTHIDTILTLSPGLRQAEAMKFQLQNAGQAGGASAVDPGIVRTSVDQVEPAMLSSRRLQQIREAERQSPLGLGLPVIPGMPPAQAVKRYKEFREFVHRELQKKCAKCHNEDSGGSFQLIQARVRADLLNEHLVRANFDAVLRLVNPRDPSQSELLTRSISPHPPDNRPILTGANDPTYRMLDYWVRGLHCPTAEIPGPAPDAVDPAADLATAAPAPAAPPPAPTGGFASDRAAAPGPGHPPTLSPTPTGPAAGVAPATAPTQSPHSVALPGGRIATMEPGPAGQLLPGGAALPGPNPPPASEFPTSPLVGGPNPASIPVRGVPTPASPPPAAAPNAPATPGQPTIHVPGLGDIPVDTRSTGNRPAGAEPPKPVDIKKDALQRFMSGRAGPR